MSVCAIARGGQFRKTDTIDGVRAITATARTGLLNE